MKGQPRYQPGEIVPGTIYRVVQPLGSGGMGTVYEVEDTTVGKPYVLKTLNAELADRADLHARMAKEARTLARLSHPNIVEVVTAGATNDALELPFIVMEKLIGHSLRAVLDRQGKLPILSALAIATDLLDALDFAHAHGVIHRDVKPDNIFLHRRSNGVHVTKLLDFGILMLMAESPAHVGRRFVGTFRYASPEQLRGDSITGSSDIYAAGLLIYEMLTGVGPFDDAPTNPELADAHIHRPPPSIRSMVDIPESLEQLIGVTLSKSPADRPHSAAALSNAIRQIEQTLRLERASGLSEEAKLPFEAPVPILPADVAGEPILARTTATSSARAKRARRLPLTAIAFATLLGIIALAIALSIPRPTSTLSAPSADGRPKSPTLTIESTRVDQSARIGNRDPSTAPLAAARGEAQPPQAAGKSRPLKTENAAPVPEAIHNSVDHPAVIHHDVLEETPNIAKTTTHKPSGRPGAGL